MSRRNTSQISLWETVQARREAGDHPTPEQLLHVLKVEDEVPHGLGRYVAERLEASRGRGRPPKTREERAAQLAIAEDLALEVRMRQAAYRLQTPPGSPQRTGPGDPRGRAIASVARDAAEILGRNRSAWTNPMVQERIRDRQARSIAERRHRRDTNRSADGEEADREAPFEAALTAAEEIHAELVAEGHIEPPSVARLTESQVEKYLRQLTGHAPDFLPSLEEAEECMKELLEQGRVVLDRDRGYVRVPDEELMRNAEITPGSARIYGPRSTSGAEPTPGAGEDPAQHDPRAT